MYYRFLSLLVLATLLLSGCASSDNSDSTSASTSTTAVAEYYYDAFANVAIPQDMEPSNSESFSTYTADGVQVGIRQYKGRVDINSLVNVMQRYMVRDGWTMRTVFRAKRSMLVFDRHDRICSLYITDGLISTTMWVFVAPKLADGAVHAPAASSPAPAASYNSGGVQSYPSGGFSGGGSGERRLSQ